MKNLPIFFVSLFLLLLVGCNERTQTSEQTILQGNVTLLSDESLVPIIEDQIAVFESEYDAKINLVAKPETEVINALLNDAEQVAVLSRNLNENERRSFQNKKISPRITKFATDAVALIRNASENDTLISLQDVVKIMRGETAPGINGLVFDNPNSSTARYLCEIAGVTALPEKNVYSFATTADALKYMADNRGMVGVVGLNWLLQPSDGIRDSLESVVVLSVKGIQEKEYYFPSQNNLAEGKYPLARDLFLVNCQGFTGLGMGFASFVAGERGQRIILKSGLLPVRIPGRKIIIRNEINKK